MWLDKASKLGDPDALYALGAENHAGGGHVEEGEKMLVEVGRRILIILLVAACIVCVFVI